MCANLKKLVYDLVLIFLNYFVAYIPCWHIRRFIYRLAGMKIGRNSRINQKVFVYDPWNIEIGTNTIVNSFVLLDGRGGLKIGSNTSISMKAVIYTASHKTYSEKFEYYERKTVIGNCCWICVGSVLLPGTVLEDRAVIGANAVFKGQAKMDGIYVGNPAVYVRQRCLQNNYEMIYKEFFT